MAITTEAIKKLIKALGFVPVDGEADVFHKKYAQHGGYALRVDFTNKSMEYVDTFFEESVRITVGSRSTSNFTKDENLVVLECIDRLLEKGYSPNSIELEKVYPAGRGHSGELDILVNDADGQAFLMIECKTWGKQYAKEVEKMLATGGQLFTYFKNATSAKSLCLYTSRLTGGKVEYENNIVDVSEDWKALSETKDIHERWNKIFKKNGIFEEYAHPYNIVHKRLTYSDLTTMKDEDGRKIFHQIMTILRHNGVSDKPNAFNKLLNLFVCKIIDEDRNPDDELQFQCWEGLSDEKLQMTLNDLYKEGMWRFLEIRVIDHSENDVDRVLQELGISDTAHKQRLMEMFSDTRLKKSPNFAFIEVQDEKTFQLNAKIVREVVELLQQFKFRYEQKHEFLGDFFEKMLNTSMKQEAGQFFTPVPITRFIISSLPIRDFVQKKIDAKDPDPLPTVIDYACGSGHFLTEFMSLMQTIIETVDVSNASPRTRGRLNSWRGDVKFSWADEYVYGIDFDNRLVKTAKVSAFFNGDGEATIIWGDGLDSFEHSDVYRRKLKETLNNKQDNGQFNILISNPPYSVEAFRRMLKHGAESFDLYSGLTDNSSEIECLFIERMKQLLKVGGWAGVILPNSILSNGGIYARARDIIFKYFNVKAIVELGSGTFMETGTNTVILFLERRPDNDHEKIMQLINTFFSNKCDAAVSGIERAFSAYVANVYDDLAYEDYISFVSETPNDVMIKHELYKEYIRDFGTTPYPKAFDTEKEKMLYFFLTYNQDIVVAKSGSKKDEIRAFLGYKFSDRRGDEGIKISTNGTMLFDETGKFDNPQKVNSYIHNAFLGNPRVSIHEAIANHVNYSRLSDLIEYGISKFGKRINLRKQAKIVSSFPYKRLSEIVNVESGLWTGENPPLKNINVIRGADFTLDGNLSHDNIVRIDVEEKAFTTRKLKYGDIILEKSGGSATQAVGRVVFFDIEDGEYSFSNFTARLRVVDDCALPKYLHKFLHYYYSIGGTFSAQKDGKGQLKNLNMEEYLSIEIPLPPLEIQRQIISEIEAVSNEIRTIEVQVLSAKKSIDSKFLELFGDPSENPKGWDVVSLSSMITHMNNGMARRGNDENGNIVLRLVELQDGYIDYKNANRIILTEAEKERYLLDDGDFLFVRVNGNPDNVGRCANFSDLGEPVYHNDHIIRVKFNKVKLNVTYANFLLNSEYGKSQMRSKAKTSAGQYTINQTGIREIKLLLPPLTLQEQFADFSQKTYDEITKHQQFLNETLQKRDGILLKHL